LASPVAALLYAYAFYQPTQGWEAFYRWVSWIDQIPLRMLLVGEIVFLVITIASVTLHMRKYGALALEEICEDDEDLRKGILSVIPNTLTLMNGVLGVAAVVFASYGLVTEALFILIGAAFFDRLDGLVARRLGLSDPSEKTAGRASTGALLDDVSDAISFALAPALMFYIVISELPLGNLPWELVPAAALLYGVAGISRLIYFTIDKNPIPGFFKGMPVPAAALLATSVIEIVHQVHIYLPQYLDLALRFGFGAMVVWAVVMNLFPLRYLHIGRWFGRNPALMWGAVVLWLGMVFTPFYGVTVLLICGLYLISPLFTGRISPELAEIEQRLHRGNPTR
ncbi:MAG: CDP-alcohol phosphatidyltransferase family protein, partial [bacterium]